MDTLLSVGKAIRHFDNVEKETKIGSIVNVCCGNQYPEHFSGKVLGKNKEDVYVKFPTRRTGMWISKDKIREYRQKGNVIHISNQILRLGSKVFVPYQETNDGMIQYFREWPDVYPATIVGFNNNGTVVINYDDKKEYNSTNNETVTVEELEFFPYFVYQI
jgi:hypothetical protein